MKTVEKKITHTTDWDGVLEEINSLHPEGVKEITITSLQDYRLPETFRVVIKEEYDE